MWNKAREIVDKALKETGLRYVGEMRIDGMAPEPYTKFIFKIRDLVNEMLKEPKRLELKIHTYAKGFGDTDVYIDGEYIYTWRPPDPYIGAFWNWVHRVYNLLKTLAERDMLKETSSSSSSSSSNLSEKIEKLIEEVAKKPIGSIDEW